MPMYINAIHLHIYFSNTSMSKIISVHNSARAREHYSTFVVVISSSGRARAPSIPRLAKNIMYALARGTLAVCHCILACESRASWNPLAQHNAPLPRPLLQRHPPTQWRCVICARAHSASATHSVLINTRRETFHSHGVQPDAPPPPPHRTTKSPTRNRTQSP